MRSLLRANSFGNRLLAGSAQLYLSIICFLIVLLAFSIQHTFRLQTQLERLHWQLALSQMLKTLPVKEQINRQEIFTNLHDTENQLNKLETILKELLNSQSSIHSEGACPGPTTEADESAALTHPFMRLSTGLALISILAIGFYAWRNVDKLDEIAPKWMVNCIRQNRNQRALSEVLAYRIDLWFSTNKNAKAFALLFVTICLVLIGSVALFSVSNVTLYDALWGSLAGVGIDWTFSDGFNTTTGISSIIGRIVSMMISLGGLLVTALLLGIVSEHISDKVDDLRKGMSQVLESNHTLILGWSDEMIPILRQICLANESIGGSSIVILAEREKEEMESEIARNGLEFLGSQIICRSGNPLLKHDLDKVSVHSARSIIVLANQQSPDQSDARVLRIVLCLVAFHEAQGLKVGYVVAEVCDMDNEPLIKLVGGNLVQTVVSHDIIGRLMIQCALQPGLAAVYDEIMGFEGCEFYFRNWTNLKGKKFSEILLSFPDAIPLGVKVAETQQIKLNVADDYIFEEDDELLVLAEDEDTYQPMTCAQVEPGLCPVETPRRRTEKVLFLGWRRDMDDMIVVLDTFVAPGSELWLYNEVPIQEREQMLIRGGLNPDKDLKNLELRYQDHALEGDLITRKKLEELNLTTFSSILVLADEAATGEDIADADSRNLATLLLLRDIMHRRPKMQPHLGKQGSLSHLRQLSKENSECVIVSEILDARTRHLIMQLNISEFVMSNEIVSMALAMVAESADVNHVLQELFSEYGSEFYLRPAEKYLASDEKLSFFELLARCRQRKEIAIGYRTRAEGKTIINPPDKESQSLDLVKIDSVIVLAD